MSSAPHKSPRTIAVVGLGYVGLPLALLFVQRGFRVLGIDLDEAKINKLRNGVSYISDIPDEAIQNSLYTQAFTPVAHYNNLYLAEAIIICVPTPLTSYGTPDLSYLTQAATEISSRLVHGQLVVLESSTYPGTTKEVLLPILNRSGLEAGIGFNVAYSPERIDPGNKDYPIESIPKVVSGITSSCLERITELYGHIFEEMYPIESTSAAEMVKLLENAYRLINISFINEMAIICDALSLNLWDIIDAASSKPFGYKAFYPGPGIGGHCIPIDPSYLQWKIKQLGLNSEFIQLSNAVNRRMPLYIVQQLKKHLETSSLSGFHILVYGAAYKRDIADYRESPSLELIEMLQIEGANVYYHDPHIPSITINNDRMDSTELTEQMVSSMNAVIIATDHSLLPLDLLLQNAPLLFDTRNATKGRSGKAQIISFGNGSRTQSSNV